jgi:hypothetical protein
LQLVAVAGVAGKVVQDAPAHRLDAAAAARFGQLEVVDRPMRRQKHRVGGRRGRGRLVNRRGGKAEGQDRQDQTFGDLKRFHRCGPSGGSVAAAFAG